MSYGEQTSPSPDLRVRRILRTGSPVRTQLPSVDCWIRLRHVASLSAARWETRKGAVTVRAVVTAGAAADGLLHGGYWRPPRAMPAFPSRFPEVQ